MRILCIGANHKTAPVALRERLAFDDGDARAALETLRDRYGEGQFVIVSTCNRSEIYLARPVHQHPREAEARALFGEFRRLGRDEYDAALYVHADAEAARHLFTVAAGLDSLVLGEEQIAAQLKAAYALARSAGATGAALNDLFQLAFNVAKHARTQTAIAAGKVSVASVAVELAGEVLGELAGRCVLSVGAGKMNELMLSALARAGAGPILVANRSPRRAAELAEACGGQAVPFEDLPHAVARADVAVCSTGSSHPVLTLEAVRTGLTRRRRRHMLIIDIAVPRDVQGEVGSLEGVSLYNIDDLSAVVERNITLRSAEIDACREIIDRHVDEYLQSLHVREVAPTVEALYLRMRQVGDEELAAIRHKLTGSPDADEKVLRGAFHRALRRILHVPISRLRESAGSEAARQQAAALRKLFNLRPEEKPAPPRSPDDETPRE